MTLYLNPHVYRWSRSSVCPVAGNWLWDLSSGERCTVQHGKMTLGSKLGGKGQHAHILYVCVYGGLSFVGVIEGVLISGIQADEGQKTRSARGRPEVVPASAEGGPRSAEDVPRSNRGRSKIGRKRSEVGLNSSIHF